MIGQRLRRARKAAGMSLRSLGESVGLSHAAIKKYEDGQAVPSSDVLLKIGRVLNVRVEYFFRPDIVALGGVNYRKRSSLPQKHIDAITHVIIDQIERRIELENQFPSPPVKGFLPVAGLPERIHDLAQVEEVANMVRGAWEMGIGPIPDLVDLLESNGVRVFMINSEANLKFDGLAASVGDMPVVVVGSNWPGDRQRFTLAHELGHLMMSERISEEIDEEVAANRFAGAFLLPRESIYKEIGKRRTVIELQELGLLKNEFGISMAAILHRALDLDIVSPSYYQMQARLFRSRGWHVKEPGDPYAAEKEHVFKQLVFHALAEEYIGESKAAELMNASLDQFRHMRAMEKGDASSYQ